MNPLKKQQPDQKQGTPSWKVNLSQKFDKFYKTKTSGQTINHIPQVNHPTLSFDDQLEQQLNFIPSHREDLSSSKKPGFNSFVLTGQNENKDYKKPSAKITNKRKENNLQTVEGSSFVNHGTKSQREETKIEKLNFDCLQDQEEQTDAIQAYYETFFSDKKVAKLFSSYFGRRQSIELKQFVEVCCLEFMSKQSLSLDLKNILLSQCSPIFCTTDESLISLNAVQMVTKKMDISLIIREKYLNAKYQKKQVTLEEQYEDILQEILKQQQEIKEDNEKLTKKKKQIELKEKQLIKREKALKNQEKQLVEKEKHIRKTLQEKTSKLMNQLSQHFENMTKILQKKYQALERNARNKLQLLQKRIINFKSQNQIQNIPEKDSDDILLSKKYQNELLLLKGKLRKTQKECENHLIEKSKEMKVLQTQSNSLLKANTLLENKLEKSKAKCKELNKIMAKKGIQIEELKREIQQKIERISQLENYVLELEHQTKSRIQEFPKTITQIPQQRHFSKNQSLQKSHQAKKLTKKGAHETIEQSQTSNDQSVKNCQQLIFYFNKLVGTILKGFQNHFKAKQLETNKDVQVQPPKIEQILLNQSQPIVLLCGEILWRSMQQKLTCTQSLTELMIKLFLAKFSFLKFQSITSMEGQLTSTIISTEDYVQNIQQVFSQTHKNQSTEVKLRICSSFVEDFEFSPQNQLSIYLTLTILGFDEIYSQKKNRLESIIHKLHYHLIKSIQMSQSLSMNNLHFIKRFEDEQLMTFLFWKYMSYSTAQEQSFIFVDILIELCNFYYSIHGHSYEPQNIPLFKTIFALENYRYLFNFLIINFTQQNLSKKNATQTFEKISIVLQRFCYAFGQKIHIDSNDVKRLKKITKQLKKNKDFDGSLFKANLDNVLDKLCEDDKLK